MISNLFYINKRQEKRIASQFQSKLKTAANTFTAGNMSVANRRNCRAIYLARPQEAIQVNDNYSEI